jgi:hypothetical protein
VLDVGRFVFSCGVLASRCAFLLGLCALLGLALLGLALLGLALLGLALLGLALLGRASSFRQKLTNVGLLAQDNINHISVKVSEFVSIFFHLSQREPFYLYFFKQFGVC